MAGAGDVPEIQDPAEASASQRQQQQDSQSNIFPQQQQMPSVHFGGE